jgi:FkbM family methyltransferase
MNYIYLLLASCFFTSSIIRTENVSAPNRAVSFTKQFVKPGNLIFDVGANIGAKAQTYLDAAEDIIVFCIDPQPVCIDYLQRRFNGNKQIRVFRYALAAQPGTAKLLMCKGCALSTLSREWTEKSRYAERYQATWPDTIDVPTVTLDMFIGQYGIPDFCKIDVENFEYDVLQGLSQPVPLLSFEFHEETKHNTIKCVKHLKKLGFDQFNFVIIDSNHFVLNQWVSADQIVNIIQAIGKNNRFGDDLCGDIYARCNRLCSSKAPSEGMATVTATTSDSSDTIFQKIPEQLELNAGELVFDIGSHCGRRTDLFVKNNLRVVCLEPKYNIFVALHNRYINNPNANVKVLNQVIANCEGELPFYACPDSTALSTCSDTWTTDSRYAKTYSLLFAKEDKMIKATTIDSLINSYGKPAYCKISTCNFEYEALRGLSIPIRYISFEFHQEFDTYLSCLDRLESLGYNKFNMTLGSKADFALAQWASRSELEQFLAQQIHPLGEPLCGEVYAWHENA